MLNRLLHFLRTGHWPKRFRYPNGIPSTALDWTGKVDGPELSNGREHG